MECKESECDRKAVTREMCHKHYMQWYTREGSTRTCRVKECARKTYGRDRLCAMHYQRKRTTGRVGEGQPRFDHRRIEDKFWGRVRKTETCWWWLGARSDGYGSIRDKKRGQVKAHRVAYELLVGPIPEGLELDHLCRHPACVNPAHLEAVTPKENKLRGEGHMAKLARKTHCKHGHPLAGDNLYLDCYGRRICRVCRARWRRERYERLGR